MACSSTSLGTFSYPYTYTNPLKFFNGTGIQTYTFLKPKYDSVNCVLEPDPEFDGGLINNASSKNCNHDIAYFNSGTKTWNCVWAVNSSQSWLTTDGTKIVVNTNLVEASTQLYYVLT